jgi:hypothetical protein
MVKGVVLTLAAAALAVLPAAAQAAPACHIHGTILEGEITTIESEAAHGNTEVAVFTHPIFLDGNLSGVGIAEERNVFHVQSNTADVQAKIAFTGTATCDDGRVLGTGGLDLNFNARVDFVTNSFTGHFEVIGSSGGLAGTHGHGTVSGEPGVPGGNGPYNGTLH